MKILVAGTRIYSRSFHGEGYIYVEGSEIEAIAQGEPPEEHQLAELVVGGRSRLAIVGLTALAFLETYPYRHHLYRYTLTSYPDSPEAGKIASKTGGEEAYYSALLAIYELVAQGYSSIIAIDPHAEAVAKAFHETGASGAILVPMDCKYSPPKPLEELEQLGEVAPKNTSIGVYACSRKAKLLQELHYSYPEAIALLPTGLDGEHGELVALVAGREEEVEVAPTAILDLVSPGPLRTTSPFISATLAAVNGYRVDEALQALIAPHETLAGRRADITVIEALEPPCYPLSSIERLAGCTPRIETVISAGNVLLDTGQIVGLKPEKLGEAAEKLWHSSP